MPRSEARKRGEMACLIPRRIATREQGTSITFAARTRPRCRSPIFTTGKSKGRGFGQSARGVSYHDRKMLQAAQVAAMPEVGNPFEAPGSLAHKQPAGEVLIRAPWASALAMVNTALRPLALMAATTLLTWSFGAARIARHGMIGDKCNGIAEGRTQVHSSSCCSSQQGRNHKAGQVPGPRS